MELAHMKAWNLCIKALVFAGGLALLAPSPAHAIPAFARKYGVKCYTCHTVPPALNKNGYMFKRLGYRMPPDEMDGATAAPKVYELDKRVKWSLEGTFALILQASLTYDNTVADTGNTTSASPSTSCGSSTSSSSSCSSFNLDEAALFVAGTVPETGFSYFGHYELYQGGSNDLEQGFGVWTGGRANSSYFIKAGEMHMQEGEGTRAAMFYNLFSDPSLTLTNVDPNLFALDQHPVGVDVGYTWASPYFKNVFAVSAKVTNGLNADGSEILDSSTKNAKDVWADVDYWFGPDGGVTVMFYKGSKDMNQTDPSGNAFTYRPNLYRVGVFGNYLFFDKLDLLGGYVHSDDDWKTVQNGPTGTYLANSVRAEADYYIKTGTVVMVRLDRMTANVTGQRNILTRAWGIGAERALTERGNIVMRAAFNQEHDGDPVALTGTTDKLFRLDIRYMW
jgi:hypothetical protein